MEETTYLQQTEIASESIRAITKDEYFILDSDEFLFQFGKSFKKIQKTTEEAGPTAQRKILAKEEKEEEERKRKEEEEKEMEGTLSVFRGIPGASIRVKTLEEMP